MFDEPPLRRRVYPVSTEVDGSGEMIMQAHLKIQPGGGRSIPRLYLHDDSGRVTGRIHVGLYRPHYLIPSTKTN